MGSPLTNLYARLLGGEFGDRPPNATILWQNLYRDGDDIGGEVKGCAHNLSLGDGGHTGYWHDVKLIERLAQ